MNKINIPEPCHENWDKMIPEGDGRHCLSCSKVVVDFTQMSLPEIHNYFHMYRDRDICGTFNTLNTTAKLGFRDKLQIFYNDALSSSRKPIYFSLLSAAMFILNCKTIENRRTTGMPVMFDSTSFGLAKNDTIIEFSKEILDFKLTTKLNSSEKKKLEKNILLAKTNNCSLIFTLYYDNKESIVLMKSRKAELEKSIASEGLKVEFRKSFNKSKLNQVEITLIYK